MPMANQRDLKSDLAGLERVADVDRRRLVGAAVLVEEAELGGDGATEREQNAESHV